ncbi:MAG: glycosyltransferase family 8 protein [Knoellia sp.]
MDVAYAFDHSYVPYAQTAIESLLDQHPDRPIRVWVVLDEDITDADCELLASQVGSRAVIEFLHTTHELTGRDLPASSIAPHISRAMYMRLLLPHLLPPDVSRVLYLDSDTLCVGPIDALGSIDLAGAVVGAVRDPYTRRLSDNGALPGIVDGPLRLDPRSPYFNSGMMLIDTAAWREGRITEVALDYIARHADAARYPDQDALNYALYERWHRLPKHWNYAMPYRLETAMGGNLADARIIHFIGPEKPWTSLYWPGETQEAYCRYLRQAQEAVVCSVEHESRTVPST